MKTWARVVALRTRSIICSKLFVALCVVAALVVSLPVLFSLPTGGDYRYSVESVQTQYSFLKKQLDSGEYDSAPQELKDLIGQELDAFEKALAGSDSPQRYYTALAQQEKAFAKEGEQGYVDDGESSQSLESAWRLTARIAELDHPVYYGSADKLPVLLYIASLPTTVPFIVFLLPLMGGIALAALGYRRSFIDQVPLANWKQLSSAGLASMLAGIMGLVLSCLPVALYLGLRNGLGDASYPVVFVHAGEVVERTCLLQVALSLVWCFLVTLTLVSFFISVFGASNSKVASLPATFVLAVFPLLTLYDEKGVPWHDVLRYLPTTYFDGKSAIGFFLYANGSDIAAAKGCTVPLGCCAMLLTAAACFAVGLGLSEIKSRRSWGWACRETSTSCADGVICLKHLTAAYGKEGVFSDAHVKVGMGELVGLIAPNGYGKTTLLGLLSGRLLAHARGVVGGEVLQTDSKRVAVYYVASTPDPLYSSMNVNQILKSAAMLFGKEGCEADVIASLDINGVLHLRAGALSAGNTQLLNIVIGLLVCPKLLLLDEPMNALDPINVERVKKALRELAHKGCGVLLSSHILEDLQELCDSFRFIDGQTIEELKGGGELEKSLPAFFREKYAR